MWSVAIVDHAGSVVEVLCQGETRLSGATSFAAEFGQSAKGTIVVMTDDSLATLDPVTPPQTRTGLRRSEDETLDPVTPPQTRTGLRRSAVAVGLQAVDPMIGDISEQAERARARVSRQMAAVDGWDVYAIGSEGMFKGNDLPLCRDGAELFGSNLDEAFLLWPSALPLPSSLLQFVFMPAEHEICSVN